MACKKTQTLPAVRPDTMFDFSKFAKEVDIMAERCYACGNKLGRNPALVTTKDGQTVYVGRDCFQRIKASGTQGWQPPKGGPRLFLR